jgi:hypothetical protein
MTEVLHQNNKVTKSLTIKVSESYSSTKVTNERDINGTI